VRFEVLGPLRVTAPVAPGGATRSRTERPLGGPKQRLVIALLLAEPNSTVSVERLIDGIWGETPPETARHTLQSYVSELRKALGEMIERDGSGYVIRVDRTSLDALELEDRVSEARLRLEHEPDAAAMELEAALALWRGRPFEDHPDHASLQAEAVRLEELRLEAIEALGHTRLALGQPARVVTDLERITREHPYREELRALQMLALYRSGRQADALRAFQATRQVLADELGIDPSPRLRRLEEQILLQDPDLDPTGPATAAKPSDARLENPYMGLRAFRESDAVRFFGRDALVAVLGQRVDGGATFTAVVGPSGSGKSSAVQAGLIPCLRRDAPHLRIVTMQPGVQPFAELQAALARDVPRPVDPSLSELRASTHGIRDAIAARLDADPERLLLVVDQFEELFTLADPDEATAFIDGLLDAVDDPRGRVGVLVTMRADFYDRPLADPRLGARFGENVVNVVPLGPNELEAAATLPARQLDVVVEPRLVGRLIVDVAGQPNALPLFQYALTELFDERSSHVLDLETYDRIGGVRKAVARRAESIYTHLDGPEQQAVRQLFLRIATVSGEAVGRRRVPASELAALDVDIVALQGAIDAFTRYRLLALDRDPTTDAPTVEVAHEALLAEWHRLRDWIDEGREDLVTHARLVAALNEWDSAGRDPGYLLAGTRLERYEAWRTSSAMQLTDLESAFFDESVRLRDEAEAEDRAREVQAQRLRRRTRWQLVALFTAVALLAGIVAYPLVTDDGPRARIAVALQFDREESGFDGLIARGIERSAREHGFESFVVGPPYSSVDQAVAEAADGSDLVFGSRLMWDGFSANAARYPDATWVFLDVVDPEMVPNAVALAFAHEEGSFLVGAAAALESETGKVGYIGANASPGLIETFRAGFEQGARAVRPDVEVISTVLFPEETAGNMGYQDVDQARFVAERMYTELGVDVIYTAAGGSGRGVIDAATELSDDLDRHLWAIGVDTDYMFELPAVHREHLLTSMLKRLDLGIEQVVADYANGTLEVPSSLRLGLAEGAVGYSTAGGHLGPATLATLRDLEDQIVRGDLVVDRTPTAPVPPWDE
jgi:basic membrane lipoprotein Med (substrate-binding protein (PBP1-ABC) superfamily)/DNA-binding SARP family transcriptional activator